jgi:ribulose bisphosphate carboxylase small subunit
MKIDVDDDLTLIQIGSVQAYAHAIRRQSIEDIEHFMNDNTWHKMDITLDFGYNVGKIFDDARKLENNEWNEIVEIFRDSREW